MIQRKQSLYLLLSCILLIVTGGAPLFTFDTASLTTMTGWRFENVANETITHPWGVAVFFILAAILAIVAIFRFKDRKRQLFLVNYQLLVIIVGCVAVVAYGLAFGNSRSADMHCEYGLLLPPLAGVFSFLARRGIQKDEELVRAADRIR